MNLRDEIIGAALTHQITDDGLVNGSAPVPNDAFVDQVKTALELMRTVPAANARSTAINSYHLKHRVERQAGSYISNGAVIVAAHLLGLDVWPCGDWNAVIGLRKRACWQPQTQAFFSRNPVPAIS